MIPQPVNMTVTDWADQVVSNLASRGLFGKLADEAAWQDWGAQFLNSPQMPRNLPNPYTFDVWADWAERFYQTIMSSADAATRSGVLSWLSSGTSRSASRVCTWMEL